MSESDSQRDLAFTMLAHRFHTRHELGKEASFLALFGAAYRFLTLHRRVPPLDVRRRRRDLYARPKDFAQKPIEFGNPLRCVQNFARIHGRRRALSLGASIRWKVEAVPGVTAADIELVWDPAWNPSMMTEAAKLQLGMF